MKIGKVFYQKLETGKIGSVGHSWGGAAVVQPAFVDSLTKAVINIEGAQGVVRSIWSKFF